MLFKAGINFPRKVFLSKTAAEMQQFLGMVFSIIGPE